MSPRILVTCSRTWSEWSTVRRVLAEIYAYHPDAVLHHGDAPKGDRQVASMWLALGGAVQSHPADWKKHGRAAGFRRNAEMVELVGSGPHVVLAFIRNHRGGPLKRTTPLRAKADKPKRKRDVPKQRTASDGPSEAVLEDRAKKAVKRRSDGDCEIRTSWCLGRATNFSHRRHEGQGGPWEASNGLDACGWGNATGCHGYLHQHPVEAKENGWLVSSTGDWRTTPAWIWHKGRRAKYLLDDEGNAVLAPFPQGDPRHPDDIPWSPPTAPDSGAAA